MMDHEGYTNEVRQLVRSGKAHRQAPKDTQMVVAYCVDFKTCEQFVKDCKSYRFAMLLESWLPDDLMSETEVEQIRGSLKALKRALSKATREKHVRCTVPSDSTIPGAKGHIDLSLEPGIPRSRVKHPWMTTEIT